MNLCIFSGRLTRDGETRYTQSGKPVTNFCIAVDTGFGDYKRTEFINCVLWNREGIGPHLVKGKPITISGEYAERKYNDRDGNERRIVEIKVDNIEFQQGSARDGEGQQERQQGQRGNSQSRGGQNRQQGNRGGSRQQPPQDDDASGMDDIPF